MNASLRAVTRPGDLTVSPEAQAHIEARLETAVWGAGIGLREIDLQQDCARWFSDWCERLSVDPCEGPSHVARWGANVHPDDVEEASRRFRAHVAGEAEYYDAEYPCARQGRALALAVRAPAAWSSVRPMAPRRAWSACAWTSTRARTPSSICRGAASAWKWRWRARGAGCGISMSPPASRATRTSYTACSVSRAQRSASLPGLVSRVHPEDTSRVQQAMRRTIDGTDELYEAEYRLRHADGTWRWALDRGRALERDASGKARRLVGFIVEIADPHSLEREIIEIGNREQQRIANDLHDGLGQDLTGIALMLRGIGAQLRNEGSSACVNIEDVIGLVNVAIENTRALARGLSPVSAERDGLAAALQALAARATERCGIPVTFEARVTQCLPFDDTAATHLYRIAQEALTNALRHSLATAVTVSLATTASEVQLQVTDNGRGFSGTALEESDGLGLKIMRYRAQMLGGNLAFGNGMAGGAIVRCSCPLGS